MYVPYSLKMSWKKLSQFHSNQPCTFSGEHFTSKNFTNWAKSWKPQAFKPCEIFLLYSISLHCSNAVNVQ